LAHFLIILGVFWITYKLRIRGDFLPMDIPLINVQELMIFAVLSAFVFVVRGLIKDLYELNNNTESYIKTLSKVWMYRWISITFVSYFGQELIFVRGISRFVILSTVLLSYLFLFLFDQAWYAIEWKLQKKAGKKILIISNNTLSSGDVIDKINQNFSFPTEFIEWKDMADVDLSQYSMTVVL
jgi:hypothetical protein